jgi:hypothetical protein
MGGTRDALVDVAFAKMGGNNYNELAIFSPKTPKKPNFETPVTSHW